MEVVGIAEFISQREKKTQTFETQNIWVTVQGEHPQTINIQFNNSKCDLLNNIQLGQLVKVYINLQGRKHQNQTTGVVTCYNTINGWKIEPAQQQQGYSQNGYQGQGSAVNAYQNQNNGYGSQPQQNFNQNPSYGGIQNYGQPPQQGYAQQQHPSGFPPANNASQGFNQAPPQQNFNQAAQGFPPAPDFGNQNDPDDLPF